MKKIIVSVILILTSFELTAYKHHFHCYKEDKQQGGYIYSPKFACSGRNCQDKYCTNNGWAGSVWWYEQY